MRTVLPVLAIVVFPSLAHGQVPAGSAPPPPPPRWERKAELSLVATAGNTDTQTLGTGASVVFRPEGWTTDARVAFVRSEANDLETAKSFVGDFRQARNLNTRVEIFGRYGYLSDRFAGVEHRNTVDGGIGYKLLPGPIHLWRVDGGVGYSREDRVVGDPLSFTLANLGTAYKWTFSKSTNLSDSAILTLPFDQPDARRFTNAFALAAAMTRALSLKLAYDTKFNQSPVPGFKKWDRLTSAAIVASF